MLKRIDELNEIPAEFKNGNNVNFGALIELGLVSESFISKYVDLNKYCRIILKSWMYYPEYFVLSVAKIYIDLLTEQNDDLDNAVNILKSLYEFTWNNFLLVADLDFDLVCF